MKVRMLIGETGDYESHVPAASAWLEPVAYPMDVTYCGDDIDHPDTVTITNDAELETWADSYFGESMWEIWNMNVPEGAIVEED